MKGIGGMIEEMLTEIASAEEAETRPLQRLSGCFNEWFGVLFIAITFAEAGEIDTARDPSGGGTGDGEHPVAYCLSGFSAGRA